MLPQHSLGHLSGLASRLFNRLLTQRFKAAGIDLTAEQWGVMLALRTHGSLSQKQLSEQLYLEKSSVSRSVKGLIQRGWLNQQNDTKDSRIKLISLSDKSLAIAQECTEIAQQVLLDAQQGIPPDALHTSQHQLSQVIRNLRDLNNPLSNSEKC